MLSVIKTAQANLTIFTEGFASDLCPPLLTHTHELHLLHPSFFLVLLRIVI